VHLPQLKTLNTPTEAVYTTRVYPHFTMSSNNDRLFQPLKLGHVHIKHRVVLAPLTRFRADDNGIPLDIVTEYYAQRASEPGTLLITEGTLISPRASGIANAPGIWSARQIAAWSKVTRAVHDKDCFIFLQLWALGRRADAALLRDAEGGPYPVVSSSNVPQDSGVVEPQPLSSEDIQLFYEDYATAAKNALAAGFDGVEIHAANGYLPDQFLQESCNRRSDDYGGSIENRSRFVVALTRSIISALGGDSQRVAIRLSPWSLFDNSNNNDHDKMVSIQSTTKQFRHVISELKKMDLAYLHLVESRVAGDVANATYLVPTRRNDPFIEIWGMDAPIVLAGGFTPETAKKAVNDVYRDHRMCIAIGRLYISTPDLPFRIREGIEPNPYVRETFYLKMSAEGYTDYQYCEEYLKQREKTKAGTHEMPRQAVI
jgi:NADPH2 dehydrogenase